MHRQRGNVFVIVLILVVSVVGAWQYDQHRARQKAEIAQQAEADRMQRERATQNAQRIELERRQAQAKAEKDALIAALKTVDDLVTRWEDATRVAGATARIALATPVSSMQALRRETDGLTVPPCLDAGMAALRASMDTTIDAYVTFMTNKDEVGKVLANALFTKSAESFKSYQESRASCPA